MLTWHLLKGVPGRPLVGHPGQGAEKRFVGKQKKMPDECAKLFASGAAQHDLYDDVEELVQASGSEAARLERHIAAGNLVRLAAPVVAATADAARALLDKAAQATADPVAPADAAPAETAAKARKGS